MGLFAFALLGGSLLGAGCSSQVSGGEKTSQGSLADEEPADPGGPPGCKPPEPPPDQCTDAALGDGTTCEDLGAIKQQVLDLCMQSGLALTDLKGSSDGCPGGGWSKTYYQCCATTPPPPKDGGGSCLESKVGDGATCEDQSALEQQAADACAAAGLPLTAFKAPSDCPGGQSTWAEYICCSP